MIRSELISSRSAPCVWAATLLLLPQTAPGSMVISAQTAPGVAAIACGGMQQDGVTATPLWVEWGAVEASDGTRDWTALDRDINQLRACNQAIGLHLQSQRPWLRTQEPPDVAAFARFAGDLATRYRGRIERYSIENEANAESQWPYDPVLYFQLLSAARQAIKAADPAAQVQHSGLSSGGLSIVRAYDLFQQGKTAESLALFQEYLVNSPGTGTVRQFTEAELRLYFQGDGAQRLVRFFDLEIANQSLTDAFQIHYYGPWESLAALMRWLRTKGINRPFEVWELAKRYGRQPYSDAAHAAEVARLLLTAAGEGSRYTIYVRYTDWPDKHLPGLVTDSGESLAARIPFRTVVATLAGAANPRPVPVEWGVQGYRFDTPRGELFALWSSAGTISVTLPTSASSVQVTDIAGNITAIDPAALRVGTDPLLVATSSGAVRARNISTRAHVDTGEEVMVGGFIITGNEPKQVLLRALGPSLAVNGSLADPVLALHGRDGSLILRNDNWKDTQRTEIEATAIPPPRDLEAAILATLAPGPYTAVLSGNGPGIALVEIYDLDPSPGAQLANISTRAFVRSGDHVMIGGFILEGERSNLVVRALGPSLVGAGGIQDSLENPQLEIVDSNGQRISLNDNWNDDPVNANAVSAAGLAPQGSVESAIAITLSAGAYTALVTGAGNTSGVGLVEIYVVR